MDVFIDFKLLSNHIEIWGCNPSCDKGPWLVARILEPWNDNPLLELVKPLGLNAITEILKQKDASLVLWKSVYRPDLLMEELRRRDF
jgi:hypothetical protein